VSSLYNLVRKSGGYKVSNEKLLIPSHWMYQKATSSAFTNDKYGVENDKMIDEDYDFEMTKLLKRVGSEIYTFPLFNEKFVSLVREEIEIIAKNKQFKANLNEPEEARIDEFVLNEMCPEWYMALLYNVIHDFNVLFYYLFGRRIGSGIIQLANYNYTKINKTTWHHDRDSDITVVVPLNTGEYEGGGTDFFYRESVPPLPNGTGLIFPAFGHVHRGAPVFSGDRFLLVFWLKAVPHD
jgi:hypothetical protein